MRRPERDRRATLRRSTGFVLFRYVLVGILVFVGCNHRVARSPVDLRDRASVEGRRPILIAQRGGVVTPEAPECSLAAIRLAERDRYAMVELDIRKSRDGVPIVFHDSTLNEACGVDGRIVEMEAEQIQKIRFSGSDQFIVTLDRALRECRRLALGVMLDVKVRGDAEFFRTVAELVQKHELESSAMTINSDPALREAFRDVVMLTVTGEEFRRVESGDSVDLTGTYWFGLPHRVPDEMIRRLRESGAYVVPAINTFRYSKDDHRNEAEKDIERLLRAGVEGFQIDSVYWEIFAYRRSE
ncbi:MAG: glycerophosphodiester phosphodiesterase family protein [Planctomycetota bacterium]